MAKKDLFDWDVIRRKIDGNLSDNEERELQRWMQGDVRRQRLVDSAKKFYNSDIFPEMNDARVDAAWEKFREEHQPRVKILRPKLFRWSAVACLLLLLGGAWLGYRNARVNVAPVETEAILPGGSKAYLILSDGKVIDLHGRQELTDQQVDIHLDSLGITYCGGDQSNNLVYNTLRIPQGGEYCLTMGDGTRVWLNAKTDLIYPVTFAGNERRVKLSGEAYFEVTHDAEKPFIVETDRMEVKVLGTSFNVNSYHDEPNVITTLVSGSVQVQASGQEVKTLKPSEQSSFERESGRLVVRSVNASAFTQWREGKFVFWDDDLESVMRILSRWYGMEYEFILPELKTEKFYGMLGRYSDIRELLEQFEKTGKVHFVIEGKKIIIKK